MGPTRPGPGVPPTLNYNTNRTTAVRPGSSRVPITHASKHPQLPRVARLEWSRCVEGCAFEPSLPFGLVSPSVQALTGGSRTRCAERRWRTSGQTPRPGPALAGTPWPAARPHRPGRGCAVHENLSGDLVRMPARSCAGMEWFHAIPRLAAPSEQEFHLLLGHHVPSLEV